MKIYALLLILHIIVDIALLWELNRKKEYATVKRKPRQIDGTKITREMTDGLGRCE